MLHTLAQHVDNAAFADLGREASEKLETVDVLGVVANCQLLERFKLGDAEESQELGYIERVRAVIVLRAAGEVASAGSLWLLPH